MAWPLSFLALYVGFANWDFLSLLSKLEIGHSVSLDRTRLECNIQSIMVDTNIPLWGGGLSAYGSNLY